MSDFRHSSYRLWSSLLSVALTSGIALEAQQRPSFRVGVDLVLLNVSVTAPRRAACQRPVGRRFRSL